MNNPAFANLDQSELLQLALNAGESGDAVMAIACLKEAVTRPDATAIAHFLLGAEYAQGRMYERAADEMEAAIALDPSLSIARLQLGLLLACAAQVDKACMVLEPLQELSEGHYLRAFGAALSHLVKDELPEALQSLEQGIESNHENPPLNADMARLADAIRNAVGQGAVSAPVEEEGAQEAGGLHMLLSAYMGNAKH